MFSPAWLCSVTDVCKSKMCMQRMIKPWQRNLVMTCKSPLCITVCVWPTSLCSFEHQNKQLETVSFFVTVYWNFSLYFPWCNRKWDKCYRCRCFRFNSYRYLLFYWQLQNLGILISTHFCFRDVDSSINTGVKLYKGD